VPMHSHARTASKRESAPKNPDKRDCVLWSDFESDVVEGRYRLGKLVRSEGRTAWFETQLLNEKVAMISVTESLNDEETWLDPLKVAEKIRHPNVVAILETGTATLQDTPLVYAVMEFTEENLEDVLRTRTLSAEETRQVAEGLIDALGAIHKERLVCGRMEAANVLAAGDIIKLRSDHLQIVQPDADLSSYAAKDVQGLGAVLYQCLTQRRAKLDGNEPGNDPSIQLLPPPFVQVVRRALGGHATVDEIAVLLRPAVPAAVPQPSPPALAPAKTVQPAAAPKPAPKPVMVEEDKPSLFMEEPPKRRSTPWILGGFVVLLLIVGLTLRAMLHSHEQPADSPVSASQSTQSPAPAPVATPPTATASPSVAPPARPQPSKPRLSAAAAVVPKQSEAGKTGAWRVVAFTYNHQDQAEHKAGTINEKHPDLQAGVFSPKGNGAPYLVTLGSATDRDAAFELRNKAVREGLPRDTYAQNYSH
jgi:eukaryotic-like serine/threonine-protein kinase